MFTAYTDSPEGPGFDTKAVANEFIRLALRDGKPVNPPKLQKLVYIAYGWHLAACLRPMTVEQPLAWRTGPAFPSLYFELMTHNDPSNARRPAGAMPTGRRQ